MSMDWLWQIIITITTSAIASGVSIWFFFKTWLTEKITRSIQHKYDRELETFKAELTARENTKFEALRTQLDIIKSERHTRFAHVFERTAEVLEGCYARLFELHEELLKYSAVGIIGEVPSLAERRDNVREKYDALAFYFAPHKIFVPEKLADSIDQLLKDIKKRIAKFTRHVQRPETEGGDTTSDDFIDKWTEFEEYTDKDLRKIMRELENQFRLYFAIEDREYTEL